MSPSAENGQLRYHERTSRPSQGPSAPQKMNLIIACMRLAVPSAPVFRRFLSTTLPACLSFRTPSALRQQSHSPAMLLLPRLEGERKSYALG